MKCYNCSESEAAGRLLINYMGQTNEVYLCSQCLENFRQREASILREIKESAIPYPHAWPNVELRVAQMGGPQPFPPDAGEKIRRERRLEELREKLRTAVEAEDYESAAALRDEIYRMEKEVLVDAK